MISPQTRNFSTNFGQANLFDGVSHFSRKVYKVRNNSSSVPLVRQPYSGIHSRKNEGTCLQSCLLKKSIINIFELTIRLKMNFLKFLNVSCFGVVEFPRSFFIYSPVSVTAKGFDQIFRFDLQKLQSSWINKWRLLSTFWLRSLWTYRKMPCFPARFLLVSPSIIFSTKNYNSYILTISVRSLATPTATDGDRNVDGCAISGRMWVNDCRLVSFNTSVLISNVVGFISIYSFLLCL